MLGSAWVTTLKVIFKMRADSVVHGIGRVKTKTFVTAENARFFAQAPPAPDEAPIVKRAAAAWRNDIENIPIFLFLGLIYITLGCWPEGVYIYFTIFIIARILHTIAYLNGMQPWRTIFFTVGMIVCVALSIEILATVL